MFRKRQFTQKQCFAIYLIAAVDNYKWCGLLLNPWIAVEVRTTPERAKDRQWLKSSTTLTKVHTHDHRLLENMLGGQYFWVRTFRCAAAVAGRGEVHCGTPKSKSISSSLMHTWWNGEASSFLSTRRILGRICLRIATVLLFYKLTSSHVQKNGHYVHSVAE